LFGYRGAGLMAQDKYWHMVGRVFSPRAYPHLKHRSAHDPGTYGFELLYFKSIGFSRRFPGEHPIVKAYAVNAQRLFDADIGSSYKPSSDIDMFAKTLLILSSSLTTLKRKLVSYPVIGFLLYLSSSGPLSQSKYTSRFLNIQTLCASEVA